MNRLTILLIGLAIVGFASGNWREKESFMEWLKGTVSRYCACTKL